MFNFESFKQDIQLTESMNNETINNLMDLIDYKLSKKNEKIVESKDTAINEDWDAKKAIASGNPLAGLSNDSALKAVVTGIKNKKAVKKADTAEKAWEKAFAEKQKQIMKLYKINARAGENSSKKKSAEQIDAEIKRIETRYDDVIKSADADWTSNIDAIEDNPDLQKKEKADKQAAQSATKLKVAQAMTKVDADIAMKKMGYSEEQIKNLQQKSIDDAGDAKELDAALDNTNTDKDKDLSASQKEWKDKVEKKIAELAALEDEFKKAVDKKCEKVDDYEEKAKIVSTLYSLASTIQGEIKNKDFNPNNSDACKQWSDFENASLDVNDYYKNAPDEDEEPGADEEKIKQAKDEYNKVKGKSANSKARITAYINLLKAQGGKEDKIKELEDILKKGETPEGEKLTESLIAALESILFE